MLPTMNETKVGQSTSQAVSQSQLTVCLMCQDERQREGTKKERPSVPLPSGSCSRFDLGEDEAVPP